MEIKQQRNSGIELLRLFAIFGILICHFNAWEIGGAFKIANQESFNYSILLLNESSWLWGMDVFLIITGYFSINNQKRSLTKVLKLLLQLIIFLEIKYIISAYLINEPINSRYLLYNLIPCDYFIILYCTLYVISPYINIILNTLEKHNFDKFLFTLIFIFCIWNATANHIGQYFNSTLRGISTIGLSGNQEGYTIITFILLYIIGAYIRKFEIKVNPLVCILIIGISIYLIFFNALESTSKMSDVLTWNMDHPFVILLSTFIFLLFNNLNFNSKIINELSTGVFTVYLSQDIILKKVIPVEEIIAQPWYLMIIYIFTSSIGIILIGYILHKIYHLLTNWLFKLLQPIIDILDISVN